MKKTSIYQMKLYHNYQPVLLTGVLILIIAGCQPKWNIQDPYAEVDWNNHEWYKANFHTHTTCSDGRMNPHTVVDKYYELGYSILALTDHNNVTYPWTSFSEMEASDASLKRLENEELEESDVEYEDRDPQKMGMLAIQGNELSRHHHMGSYFSNHNDTKTEEESLKATAAKNGLVMFNHPGRYTRRDSVKYSVDWYVDFLQRYNHLIGIEIYNQGDRYPNDRELYDAILSRMMPDRPVWAYSNDDMHHSGTLGQNWNLMVLPELTEEWVRKGMQQGRSFYIYSPSGHNGPELPQIQEVKVNNRKGLIEINAIGYDSIRWISDGEVVHRGGQLLLKDQYGIEKYVRAEIFGPGNSIIGTQPFGIR